MVMTSCAILVLVVQVIRHVVGVKAMVVAVWW